MTTRPALLAHLRRALIALPADARFAAIVDGFPLDAKPTRHLRRLVAIAALPVDRAPDAHSRAMGGERSQTGA